MTTTTMKLNDVDLVFFYGGARPLYVGNLKVEIHLVLRVLDRCYLVWRGFGVILVGPDKPI